MLIIGLPVDAKSDTLPNSTEALPHVFGHLQHMVSPSELPFFSALLLWFVVSFVLDVGLPFVIMFFLFLLLFYMTNVDWTMVAYFVFTGNTSFLNGSHFTCLGNTL